MYLNFNNKKIKVMNFNEQNINFGFYNDRLIFVKDEYLEQNNFRPGKPSSAPTQPTIYWKNISSETSFFIPANQYITLIIKGEGADRTISNGGVSILQGAFSEDKTIYIKFCAGGKANGFLVTGGGKGIAATLVNSSIQVGSSGRDPQNLLLVAGGGGSTSTGTYRVGGVGGGNSGTKPPATNFNNQPTPGTQTSAGRGGICANGGSVSGENGGNGDGCIGGIGGKGASLGPGHGGAGGGGYYGGGGGNGGSRGLIDQNGGAGGSGYATTKSLISGIDFAGTYTWDERPDRIKEQIDFVNLTRDCFVFLKRGNPNISSLAPAVTNITAKFLTTYKDELERKYAAYYISWDGVISNTDTINIGCQIISSNEIIFSATGLIDSYVIADMLRPNTTYTIRITTYNGIKRNSVEKTFITSNF